MGFLKVRLQKHILKKNNNMVRNAEEIKEKRRTGGGVKLHVIIRDILGRE